MIENNLFAAVTGDIISSSALSTQQHEHLLETLKVSFNTIEDTWPGITRASFEVYRGDSFQGLLFRPEKALHAAIIIRAGLRCHFYMKRRRNAVDARIAIGIGSVASLPHNRVAEGIGEAFNQSGPVMDKIEETHQAKKQGFLFILTPWEEINAELSVECSLLDALINRWSRQQARAIIGQIRGLTQEAVARESGVSQSAISQRLLDAGGKAVRKLCRRYETMIREAMKNKDLYNRDHKEEYNVSNRSG